MKKFEIRIKSLKGVLDEFEHTFEAVRSGESVRKTEGVFFTSMEAFRSFLTPERVRLLLLIRNHRPGSVYELAKLANRDLKNVYQDLKLLERHGVLTTRLGGRRTRKRRVPDVPYDEIEVRIPLAVSESRSSWRVSQGAADRSSEERDWSKQNLQVYEDARRKYRPLRIKYLLVAESPPADPNRFFYFEDVRTRDSLFLETMKVLYPVDFKTAAETRRRKSEFLRRFMEDGFYLIDAVDRPLGRVSRPEKMRTVRQAVPALLQKVRNCDGTSVRVVLISSLIYSICNRPLRDSGFEVANDQAISFPSSGRQLEFRRKFQEALKNAGWSSGHL
ncbi:MAG: hypothetical protein HYU65_02550 [Armatimonadetes bacterium]|nr:hypothetical protein [Armatimonadota bacterium]